MSGVRRNYPTFITRPRQSTTSQHLAKPEQHGTTTGYSRGCRCDRCYEARRDWDRLRRLGLIAGRKRGRTHGIRSTYTHGCRCDDCRRADRDYRRDYRRRKQAAA